MHAGLRAGTRRAGPMLQWHNTPWGTPMTTWRLGATASVAALCLSLGVSAHAATGASLTDAATGACTGHVSVPSNGVALSQFPSTSRLSAALSVTRAGGITKRCWTASSDSKWLTAKPSSTALNSLELSANPAGLATDTAYVANVTVRNSAAPNGTTTIRVGLWVGSADPGVVTLSQAASAIAANPVEPFAYVGTGSSAVQVYNVYSGALVTTFPAVAPTVGQLVVSSDGKTLFAADTTNYRIVAVDAVTGAAIRSYPLIGPIASDFSFAYAQPFGRGTLFAYGQPALDVATAHIMSVPVAVSSPLTDPLLAATPDGTKLVLLARGCCGGGGSNVLYTLSVSSLNGQLAIAQTGSGGPASYSTNCVALATSPSGSRLYPACNNSQSPTQTFVVYDGQSLAQVQTLPAPATPNNAAVDSNGDFVGGVSLANPFGPPAGDDVYVYHPSGFLVGGVPTTAQSASSGQQANTLAVSGDATRVVSVAPASPYTGAPATLMFRSLP